MKHSWEQWEHLAILARYSFMLIVGTFLPWKFVTYCMGYLSVCSIISVNTFAMISIISSVETTLVPFRT